MKKILIILALLGCALVYLQQQSLAQKVAQADPAAPAAVEPAVTPASAEAAPAPAPAEKKPVPAPEPARETAPTASAAPGGKMSHADYAKMEIKDCNVCHQSEGVAPNHLADFFSGHRLLASRAGNNCQQCHKQSWCLDCHQGGGDGADPANENFGRDYIPRSHRSDFINIHPIKALDNPQTCYRCHQPSFCNECHDRFPKGSLRIKSHMMLGPNNQQYTAVFGEHSTEARRNLQSCQACHPEGDVCIQCHSSGKVRPHPRNWKAGNYKDRTNERVCLKCHLPGTY